MSSATRKAADLGRAIITLAMVSAILVPTERQKHEIRLRVLAQKAEASGLTAHMHADIARQCAEEAQWWAKRAVRYHRVTLVSAGISGAFGAMAGYSFMEWIL